MKIWDRELYVDEENITSFVNLEICKFRRSNFYIASADVVVLEMYKGKILNRLWDSLAV